MFQSLNKADDYNIVAHTHTFLNFNLSTKHLLSAKPCARHSGNTNILTEPLFSRAYATA